jgi:hypothetical protein
MRISGFCNKIQAHKTSGLLKTDRAVTRQLPHHLLPVSQLLNEAASSMTSLSRPPIKPLPTHTPSLTDVPSIPSGQALSLELCQF